MSWSVLFSLLACLTATCWSLFLLKQEKNLALGLLTVLVAYLSLRHGLDFLHVIGLGNGPKQWGAGGDKIGRAHV